ncbi:uncharacterized protein BXZ73DRAFT_95881 [Epithele typhae]|uniref:uncharacterized protein n=1 Tax=Epithele typhae TaxID=378194 RepID=UPI002007AF96|nr:uncharacterized protein BXZ73DRAFT_95881 [Epithele typhae]KAH9946382.1 hypothetical protein BXZ73DRAFT_95881 [Epithele typhae]
MELGREHDLYECVTRFLSIPCDSINTEFASKYLLRFHIAPQGYVSITVKPKKTQIIEDISEAETVLTDSDYDSVTEYRGSDKEDSEEDEEDLEDRRSIQNADNRTPSPKSQYRKNTSSTTLDEIDSDSDMDWWHDRVRDLLGEAVARGGLNQAQPPSSVIGDTGAATRAPVSQPRAGSKKRGRTSDVSVQGNNAAPPNKKTKEKTKKPKDTQIVTRFPDWRWVMAWMIRDLPNGSGLRELQRTVVALTEVKLVSRKVRGLMSAIRRGYSSAFSYYVKLITAKMDAMLAQVIQSVQVAFGEKEGLQQVVALTVVNDYCRFIYFQRSSVPEITSLDDVPQKGYPIPPEKKKGGARKEYLYATILKSTAPIPMITGSTRFVLSAATPPVLADEKLDFTAEFKEHWAKFKTWVRNKEHFPPPSGYNGDQVGASQSQVGVQEGNPSEPDFAGHV